MAYFDGIKVGDEVESTVVRGKLVVKSVVFDHRYPVKVGPPDGGAYWTFDMNGVSTEGERQTLFYPGVQVIPPQPPKRKVLRTLVAYGNIYSDYVRGHGELRTPRMYSTKNRAIEVTCPDVVAAGIKFTSEPFEVEE